MRNTFNRLHYHSLNLYTGTFLAPSKEYISISRSSSEETNFSDHLPTNPIGVHNMIPNSPLKNVLLSMLLLAVSLTACDLEISEISEIPEITSLTSLIQNITVINSGILPTFTPEPSLEETDITFQVQLPGNTPAGETIFLSVLDEVTGLALNPEYHPMEALEGQSEGTDSSEQIYSINLPFKTGSVIKYRYERQAGSAQVAEHFTDSSPVRYRLYQVNGPNTVEDIVSQWTDTLYSGSTGRIMGEAIDADTGQGIPNLLIQAGGAQTISDSNGSFVIEGLPPGIHNLVGYALDGSYKTFQQGARIATDSTTPTPLNMSGVDFVDVSFIVNVPPDTPPVIPVRLAGNIHQLGNTFANLSGGISTLATKMPTLNPLSDGRYELTLSLPVGADIRYKYTLGDGFWNAEHNMAGDYRLRQFIVPEKDIKIEDEIETWSSGVSSTLVFDLNVPTETPSGDFVSIQFKPLFGWTESIPMWYLGENRWAYALYSPLNLPGEFSYRYCRNGQCGKADDIATPGLYGEGRALEISQEPQTITDQVSAWVDFGTDVQATVIPTTTINVRDENFWAGVETIPQYHPSWMVRLPDAFEEISDYGSNWLILSPTWTYGRNLPGNEPPVLEPIPGIDALWFDNMDAVAIGTERGMNIALYPSTRFNIPVNEWWQSAPRDYSWWLIWFDQYSKFILHHADLADQSDAQALILGGEWVAPALPGGTLPDGTSSGVPSDAEARWRDLVADVRERFDGVLLWALPYTEVDNLPPFIDTVDQIYVIWSPSESITIEDQNEGQLISEEISNWLETKVEPIQSETEKPIVLAVSYPSDPDLKSQFDLYNVILNAVNEHEWLSGFVSRGFYTPAAMQDNSVSIHGKPTGDLLRYWFLQMFDEEIQ